MPPIRFGWFLYAGAAAGAPTVPKVVAEESEVLPLVAAHFDSIWVPDHFYGFDEPAEPWLECWTTLTWLAARYPSVTVGPIVLGVGYRPPALLAKMAATLQTLSGGRFIMGIGAGWRGAEYEAYGYPFPTPGERMDQLEEAVQILRAMWTEPAPSFTGRHYAIAGAYCEPRPDPPPPLMIGGGGPKRLIPLAARYADLWDLWHGGDPMTLDRAEYVTKRDLLVAAATAAGRDPAAIGRSLSFEFCTLPTDAAGAAAWRAALTALVDLGVQQFLIGPRPVPGADAVRRFAAEVIAPLRGA